MCLCIVTCQMRFHFELFVTIDNRAFMRRTIRQIVIVGAVCIGIDVVNRNRVGDGRNGSSGCGDGCRGGIHTSSTAQWGAWLLLQGIHIVFGKTRRYFKAAVFLPVRPACVTQPTIQMSWTPCVPLWKCEKWRKKERDRERMNLPFNGNAPCEFIPNLPGSIDSMRTIRTVCRNYMQWHRCSSCHSSCCHSVCWHRLWSLPLSMYYWWSLRSVCCSSECRLVSISIRHRRLSIASAERNDRLSSTCNSIRRYSSTFSTATICEQSNKLDFMRSFSVAKLWMGFHGKCLQQFSICTHKILSNVREIFAVFIECLFE